MNDPQMYDPEGPGPDDEDLMEDGFSWEKDTVECPQCGSPILADVGHCHACGYWLTKRDRHGWPWWILAMALLAAAGLLILQIL